MRQPSIPQRGGFTIAEMMIAMSIGVVICAAAIMSFISLQQSLGAADNYFATHSQQIRVIDYLSRDVKRSYITNASADKLTVNCVVPNYVIKTGDPDAAVGVGKRRTPSIAFKHNLYTVNYGGSRVIDDAVTTSGSATVTSATGNFVASDVGLKVAGNGIPMGATIQSVTNATTAVLSANATASATAVTMTVGNISNIVYTVSGSSIVRTEDGVVTSIASSTDQLLPQSTDTQLANTEYTSTAITFLPIFKLNAANAPLTGNDRRDGTTVYSTAYLRNARRGN